MSDREYVDGESSESSESDESVRERPSDRPSVDAIIRAAVRVVDDPGVAVAAPVPDGDVPVPAVAAAAAVGGRGRGRGSRGRGRGAQGGRVRGGGSGRFRQGEGGRQLGRTNYSSSELDHMLEFARELLPISGAEWDLVASRHSVFHPELERTGDQLKKKFNKLARTQIPTGNPNIPPAVREAKEIRDLIVEKSEGVTGSEEEVFSPDDVDEYEEDGTAGLAADDQDDAVASTVGVSLCLSPLHVCTPCCVSKHC